jgi:hypothetical protein
MATGQGKALEIFLYSCFYLTIHKRRASKSGETSSKPLLFWRFFFKFSKNLRQNTPFKILFFPFWRNFASKKKEKKPLLWKALKKKARQDETQFTTKTGGKN